MKQIVFASIFISLMLNAMQPDPAYVPTIAKLAIEPSYRLVAYHCLPAFNKNSSLLAYCSQEYEISVYDLTKNAIIENYKIPGPITNLCFDSVDNIHFTHDRSTGKFDRRKNLQSLRACADFEVEATAANGTDSGLVREVKRYPILYKYVKKENRYKMRRIAVIRSDSEILTPRMRNNVTLVHQAVFNVNNQPIRYHAVIIKDFENHYIVSNPACILTDDEQGTLKETSDVLAMNFDKKGSPIYLNDRGEVLKRNLWIKVLGMFKPTQTLNTTSDYAEHFYIKDTETGIITAWADCLGSEQLVIKHVSGSQYVSLPLKCNHVRFSSTDLVLTVDEETDWNTNAHQFKAYKQAFKVSIYKLPLQQLKDNQ